MAQPRYSPTNAAALAAMTQALRTEYDPSTAWLRSNPTAFEGLVHEACDTEVHPGSLADKCIAIYHPTHKVYRDAIVATEPAQRVRFREGFALVGQRAAMAANLRGFDAKCAAALARPPAGGHVAVVLFYGHRVVVMHAPVLIGVRDGA